MKNEIIFTPFYSTFLSLCKRDNISPTEAARRAGISSGAPTAWKKDGAIPRPEQQKKLCALFNVSENELLGYSGQKKEPPAQGRELGEEVKEFIELYDRASPELRAAALAVLKSAESHQKAPGGAEGAE